MAEILLKPSEARDHANRMKTHADEARDNFQRLRSDLNALTDSFRGQAQAAFEGQFVEWETRSTQVIESLDSLATWLDQAATQLEQVDTELGSGLG